VKVLHIIPSVAPVRGGPSQNTLELAKALRKQGVEAEIATTNDNGTGLLDVPLGKCSEYKEVPVWFFPRFSPQINSVREFAFSSQLTNWLWHNASKYDLIHVRALFSYASTAAMAIARLQNLKYIVEPHGLLCQWSMQQSALKKQIYLSLIERANLNGSLALRFSSLQEQQEALALKFTSPGLILPHGLSIPASIPNARKQLRALLQVPEDRPVILFMSRLHPKKGLDYLISALGKLSHQQFSFVLAGSGTPEYEAEVETLLVNAGIRDRTYLPGFVLDETKAILLQGADLFALTSHSENFGVAVLEAMAVGLPVLVTPGVALAPIVAQHQLGYVPQLNVSAIAASLLCLLEKPHQLQKMGDRARQLVTEKYTLDRVALNLKDAYTAIINQEPIATLY